MAYRNGASFAVSATASLNRSIAIMIMHYRNKRQSGRATGADGTNLLLALMIVRYHYRQTRPVPREKKLLPEGASAMPAANRVPVTVLTGFLGSGKTTLLNRILTEQHGKRIAVIENEFGEVGIDNELVVNAEEEIFEMNNGCICCTVRGDLIRILGNLMKRKDRFDYILIETTGMADPGPVAQTFFVDD